MAFWGVPVMEGAAPDAAGDRLGEVEPAGVVVGGETTRT